MTNTNIKVLGTILVVFLFLIFYLYYFPTLLNKNKVIVECKKENEDYSLDEQIHKFMFMQDKLYEEMSEE
jgi:cellobiose-specific phosphotransferase system component IIC